VMGRGQGGPGFASSAATTTAPYASVPLQQGGAGPGLARGAAGSEGAVSWGALGGETQSLKIAKSLVEGVGGIFHVLPSLPPTVGRVEMWLPATTVAEVDGGVTASVARDGPGAGVTTMGQGTTSDGAGADEEDEVSNWSSSASSAVHSKLGGGVAAGAGAEGTRVVHNGESVTTCAGGDAADERRVYDADAARGDGADDAVDV
jgi:hypothetical protein